MTARELPRNADLREDQELPSAEAQGYIRQVTEAQTLMFEARSRLDDANNLVRQQQLVIDRLSVTLNNLVQFYADRSK